MAGVGEVGGGGAVREVRVGGVEEGAGGGDVAPVFAIEGEGYVCYYALTASTPRFPKCRMQSLSCFVVWPATLSFMPPPPRPLAVCKENQALTLLVIIYLMC